MSERMSVTSQLTPGHRKYKWRDREGWVFVWGGDEFWHIYRPDGTHADDLIEEVLNDYSDGGYGPWEMVDDGSC